MVSYVESSFGQPRVILTRYNLYRTEQNRTEQTLFQTCT